MYPNMDFFTEIPWGRQGMRNYHKTWFPEGLGLIVNLIDREET